MSRKLSEREKRIIHLQVYGTAIIVGVFLVIVVLFKQGIQELY